MNYTTIGEGQPLVLFHGFGENSHIWRQQLPALRSVCRLVIPELPGTGSSPETAPLTIESMAEGIRQILDTEKIDKALLLGHSMGGYITLAFAEKFPERLSGFGLIHSTAFADSPSKIEARKKSIDFINTHGTGEYLQASTPNLFHEANRQKMASTINDLVQENNMISSSAMTAFLAAMMQRPDRTAVLRQTEVPVLFIVGCGDQAVPFEDAMKQVYLPKLSYIHILRQSGHLGMLEEPQKCTEAILQFVRDPGKL